MFFVFDGLDGSGKTTQLDRFVTSLEALDRTVVVAKDPGTTALGEQLRSILLNSSDMPIHMRAEMMMFTTARTQLVEEIVRPALANDHIVVLDRYVLSTVVYQGIAGKLDPDSIRTINQIATDDIWPDHTFILDLPVDVAMGRLGKDLYKVFPVTDLPVPICLSVLTGSANEPSPCNSPKACCARAMIRLNLVISARPVSRSMRKPIRI